MGFYGVLLAALATMIGLHNPAYRAYHALML